MGSIALDGNAEVSELAFDFVMGIVGQAFDLGHSQRWVLRRDMDEARIRSSAAIQCSAVQSLNIKNSKIRLVIGEIFMADLAAAL
jgi:hypothetical protein